jgi:hypothetical protein
VPIRTITAMRTGPWRHLVPASIMLGLAAAACAAPTARSVTLPLAELDESGVRGTVVIAEVDEATTLVTIDASPAGHPDMPAHIHPGSCDDLVPQPRFALENVVDGRSATRVPASFDDITAAGQAVNLHQSNSALDVYTACVDL